MKPIPIRVLLAALLLCLIDPLVAPAAEPAAGFLSAGVGSVDITPTEPVILAGSPTRFRSTDVGSRLFVKALVLGDGERRVAIVTLDTLKYPVDQVLLARKQIEKSCGIPADNVIICASHTHRGPLWPYYSDKLVTPIAEAVAQAVRNVAPCTLGVAKGKVEGVSQCRRVVRDGTTWNRWQLPPGENDKFPAEGSADPEFDVLALTDKDGKHQAIVYNFACHASNTRELVVSADFPGDTQKQVEKSLGYAVPTLFLTGACGDVNPVNRESRDYFGEQLGGEIARCLQRLAPIARPTLAIETREIQMPGREQPELKEADIALKWPRQLEHYKTAYESMKKRERPSYQFFFTGIRIGPDLAIVTNPTELFCDVGLQIKRQSPFKHTMVAEQTNGAHGYVPTAKAFVGGSYETWFGEHSYLTVRAHEVIETQSLEILRRLKPAP